MSRKPKNTFEYVDTQAALEPVLTGLERTDWVAIDTEADSFHHYYPKVCLIQLSFGESNYIIDPLAHIDLKGFFKILSHKDIIIHDAGYDLRMMLADYNYKPHGQIFDTMLAGKLVGLSKVNHAALIQEFIGKQISKQNQRADWSHRPLDGHMLDYAIDDTQYLIEIASQLRNQLAELGRTEWHEEYCKFVVKSAMDHEPQSDDPENDWRIKGASQLEPHQMAYLRGIRGWREKKAQIADLPPFRIMNNVQLLVLAVWAAEHKRKSLDNIPKLPKHCYGKRLEALKQAIETARAIPSEEYPQPRKSDPTKKLLEKFKKRVDKIKIELDEIGKELNLEPQLLASRAALTEIVIKDITTITEITQQHILMHWQAKLVVPALHKVLRETEK